MVSYSSYFSFGNGPSIQTREVPNKNYSAAFDSFGPTETQRYVDNGNQDTAAANAFDAIMAGHDATSNNYVKKLQSIYDGYAKYAKDFGDKAQPIMDALGGDITDMQGYIQDYGKNLADIKDTMLNGIMVDPNATRTREEYQGNLAAAYGKQREQQKQSMESQGLNPYANKGADRQASQNLAAGMTNAGNTAYSDWRKQYNSDIQAKQQAAGTYGGLLANQAGMQGTVMQARGGLIDDNKSIMDAKIGADQARANGTEGLLSLAENRRSEALKLAQQQQENQRQNADITQQLQAKIA